MPLAEICKLVVDVVVGGITIAVLLFVLRNEWDRAKEQEKRVETLERIVIEQGERLLATSEKWRSTVDSISEAMRDLLQCQQEVARKAELNGLVRKVVEESRRAKE